MIQDRPMTDEQIELYDKVHKILITNYGNLIKTITNVEVDSVSASNGGFLVAENKISGLAMDALLCAIVDSFASIIGSLIGAVSTQGLNATKDEISAAMMKAYTARFTERVRMDLINLNDLRNAYADFYDKGQQHGTA